jgi:starvation-inducible outer membrane lipoprotein
MNGTLKHIVYLTAAFLLSTIISIPPDINAQNINEY